MIDSPTITPSSQFLVCRVGSYLLGLPIDHVTETMRPLPCELVAGTPEFVRGISMIRGTAVPVVDAGLLLRSQSAGVTRLVTIGVDGRSIAIAVDSVVGVTPVLPDALRELPPLLEGTGGSVIEALGELDSELLIVLEESRLLPESVWDLLQEQATP